ncbi:MAG: TIGR04282 family arsenosugar biosynthesis glycosyltransferase [Candidatus Omnitrophica bacterium]|nr:TIGR04282 family arsenosugar biosynthesis glycosyltransferase [Candidatus Omnitrophota bacterium]
MNTALIVFAREPQKGKVKTRLQQNLPAQTVLDLYKAFLMDVLNMAAQVPCGARYLYHAGAAEPILALKKSFRSKFMSKRQTGTDLGQRMHRALKGAKRAGARKMMIIGTDCLMLTPTQINQAFDKLSRYDVVIGPSQDGGYYLIGLKEPDERLFKGIRWGKEEVLDKTRELCRKFGKSVALLRTKNDIDYLSDLKQLKRNTNLKKLAPKTASVLGTCNNIGDTY